ncbi:unnamed protein product [Ambrosiozyma monospora]|uniref:Unnamed protein product n=1 Tax=Ambrosiozyma monospora TaxID=43982 RepID=A0A9W6YX38_AMBMO|nr:unnamed protein product [Ambrosiozyma monospora]
MKGYASTATRQVPLRLGSMSYRTAHQRASITNISRVPKYSKLARSCSTLTSSIKGSTCKIKSTKSNTPHQLKIVRFNSYQTPPGNDDGNSNNNNKYNSFPDKKFTEDEFDNLFVTFRKITHDESLTPYQMNDAVNRLFDAYHMEDAEPFSPGLALIKF